MFVGGFGPRGRASAKLIKNLAQLLHWSIWSLRCSPLFPTGESFQCFHLISAELILPQHLMFHWVADWGGLKSSAGAAYCRLRLVHWPTASTIYLEEIWQRRRPRGKKMSADHKNYCWGKVQSHEIFLCTGGSKQILLHLQNFSHNELSNQCNN